jgi:probable phosphoglycerate mutase
MAEELATYDQIGGPGDPDPLGLEKKLAQLKSKADPLGLEAKLRASQQPKQEQPAFQLLDPTFRSIPREPVVVPSAPNEKINISQGEVKYIPDEKTYELQRQQGRAKVAHEKVNTALVGNDAQYEKKLRESRRDNYTVESLRNEYKQKGIILSPQDEQKALQREKERLYNLPVTSDELTDFKTGTILTPKLSRKFIKDLNDKEVAESAYQVDKFNELANDPDPNAHKRIEKINEVAKGIKKGTYVYDPETKAVVQPMGMVGSIIEGVKNKFKADEEHDFLKNTSNDAAVIMELENERNNPDVDQPIKVPRGKLNEALNTIAEMPITPIVAGVAGTVGGTFIGNPELGTAAAASLLAYENRKAQYRATFKQVYNELRDQGRPEFEALNEARNQAENAQEIGTVVGAAQGLIGAKIAEIPINGATFNLGYQKAVGQFLKNNGVEFGKIALDAAAQGGLGAAGEIAKNKLAQAAGIKRDWDAGAADAFYGNAIMAGGIGAALKLGRGLSKINYKTILNGLTKNVPEEAINSTLQEKVATGEITQDAANQAFNEIKEYKEKDAQIPPNVTEEARFKIQDNIDKITELEQRKEATHKSLQGPIKEQIDKLVDENLALSKETVKQEKLVSGLSKDKEKEAIDFAHELVDEGILPDTYGPEVKKDPIKFWQTIAQQAQNRDENWKPLANPLDEQAVKDNYGETVVDYAKDLFPAPEVAESKISVIQPGEIQRPEVRTIAPREQPREVKSTKNVSVIMPGEAGAGKVNAEQVGHVEVSEHGEDAKTAAGKENGIGPSPLTEDGMKEAKQLGQYIAENNKSKIITSEVERGLQTAEEAAKEAKRITGKEVPIERNELLNTANIGSDEGKPEGTFKEKEWFEGKYMPDGAESPESFKTRMEKAYEYVKSLPEDTHVVSHSKVMRALDALSKTGGKWTDETTKDFITNKELSHAVPVESTNEMDVRQQTTDGEGMGAGNIQPESTPREEVGGELKEEGKNTGKEGVADLKIDEVYELPFIEEPGDKKTGIKNIISKATRFERKLPPVEVGKLGTDQEVLLEGKSLVDNSVINPIDIVNRILDTKEGMQPDEAKAMLYYMHQLAQHDTNLRERLANATADTEKAELNEQLQQLSDEIDAATQANIISGKAWSDVGNIRQIVTDNGFNASRDLATIKDAYGGKIPKDVQAKLDRALKERDEALNKLAKLQAEEKNKAAEDTVKKQGAPKNTKKTSTDFKAERSQIKKDILDKLKKGRTGESGLTAVPLPFAKELISITPEIFKLIKSYAEEGVQKTEEVINRLHDVLKDELDGITKADIVNLLAGKYKEQEGLISPIAQRLRDFRTEANLWTKIAEATKMEEDTPQKKQEKNKKLQDLRGRLNNIREKNKEAIVAAKDILTTDVQKEIKKLQQRRKGLESRYKNKKYLLPAEKKQTPFSEEILKEKQRIVNANYKIRIEKRRAFESQKNMYQKALMWVGRGVRLSVLSGYNVLGKLAAAATIGGAAKRIPEQMIGAIYGHAFKGVAEKAPIEGFVNAGAEAKFYKEFFNPKKFVKNSWEILKSGESPLSKKFSPGTYEHIPGLYLPTDLHQVIKDPLKRGVYEASLKNALVWAERNGLDINDDLVLQSLETAAYKRAQYEIFQEQNWLSKRFGEWKHDMEASGNIGATYKFLADFMIPVSTVPTNIARRMVSTSPFGLIKGGVDVINAYRKGIESLAPEEADSVMRQLKQGTLGTALWLIGWYGYSQFGGLYSKFNPNKQRDQGDLISDEMSVGGKMIPKPVQHALPLEIIQFAATARRVYDNYRENKHASTPESIEKAGLASVGALTEQIPVVETIAHTIGAFNNPYEAKKLEEDVKRRFEPQILKETGIIGKEKGGSGGGAGATGSVGGHKTTKHKTSHSTHKTR